GLILGCVFLMEQVSTALVVSGILLAVLNAVFYYLLKAPTLVGRKIIDQIEGFRLFLSTAEKERLNTLYPGGRTPQLFEEYLPYALALDLEQAWAERFDDVMARAGTDGQAYHPVWYYGSDWSNHDPAIFASSLGSSFSHAISSSATPPGSSSGFGGGGSSGGGGGGGGGGGW
ncbi:MAG TPA: DUF2207 domain-containing protein, partial [Bacillota bacterium]|nr:DUF2207 domain-containing protein [Bacillota bacterium]